MTKPSVRDRLDRVLLSEAMSWILPTPATYYFNRVRLKKPMDMPDLPAGDWSRQQRRNLLSGSEDRLRNIEGKGPGLATVSAVIVGAVVLALASGWHESTWLGRLLLVLAAMCGGLSLLMPLYLVGPIERDTLHVADLQDVAGDEDPEEGLADRAARAAMRNDLRNLGLVNLLDAARRELSYTFALLLLWGLLVPATGVLRRQSTQDASAPKPVSPAVTQTPVAVQLTSAVASASASEALARALGKRWQRGSRKTITCRRLAADAFDCTARWRYRKTKQSRVITVSQLAGKIETRVRRG
jgi:hypothetical protein